MCRFCLYNKLSAKNKGKLCISQEFPFLFMKNYLKFRLFFRIPFNCLLSIRPYRNNFDFHT